ncbi:helix-turn-helix domain-containing protein [Nakamurella antarctica]|uniref:Helix-turn-helix domain-containing protein n=1 Tax=Nakamurella antarctica TaxID=1902245 RepID=A0A3G8ZNA3_9ACTN|nr:helix-turn-helix domain-containing protein [Nakamurella antarctica]AZI58812.1 helix-turn-helix domain-containing protein [Nakamurella antarctica]
MAKPGPTTSGYHERLPGNILKLARAQKGLSQRQLANAAGTAQSYIARIESGTVQPSMLALCKILAAADLELRPQLASYDDHDDVLDRRRSALTDDQRSEADGRHQSMVNLFTSGPAA